MLLGRYRTTRGYLSVRIQNEYAIEPGTGASTLKRLGNLPYTGLVRMIKIVLWQSGWLKPVAKFIQRHLCAFYDNRISTRGFVYSLSHVDLMLVMSKN